MTPAAVTAWRRRLGLNKKAAGAALGVHPRTITNWETGRTAPELRDRLAMAAITLGLTDYHGPDPTCDP